MRCENKRRTRAFVSRKGNLARMESVVSGKRELIEPNGDKRYVRRDEKGQFSESDDVSRSLSRDVKQHAKTEVKPGYGDKGDQKRKE